MKIVLSAALLLLLGGCGGLATVKLYDGPEQSLERLAVLSSAGLYPERKLSVQVLEIDDKTVDTDRTSEFLLLPGPHRLRMRVWNDLRSNVTLVPGGAQLTSTLNLAIVNITADFLAGHTYIPNVRMINETVVASLDDVGKGFKQECLPVRRFAIFYGGSADGKKTGC